MAHFKLTEDVVVDLQAISAMGCRSWIKTGANLKSARSNCSDVNCEVNVFSRSSRWVALCFGLIGLVIQSAWAGELSQHQVQQLIQSVEQAANELDVEALAQTLSDDAVIQLDISMLGEHQVVEATKQEYLKVITEAWSRFERYGYRRSNTEITLSGDHAVVQANVHESMVIDGHSLVGTSHEKVIIRLIEGQPKITEVIGSSSL